MPDAYEKMRQEARDLRERASKLDDKASDGWKELKSDIQSAADKTEESLKKAWEDLKS